MLDALLYSVRSRIYLQNKQTISSSTNSLIHSAKMTAEWEAESFPFLAYSNAHSVMIS